MYYIKKEWFRVTVNVFGIWQPSVAYQKNVHKIYCNLWIFLSLYVKDTSLLAVIWRNYCWNKEPQRINFSKYRYCRMQTNKKHLLEVTRNMLCGTHWQQAPVCDRTCLKLPCRWQSSLHNSFPLLPLLPHSPPLTCSRLLMFNFTTTKIFSKINYFKQVLQ